MTDIPVSESTQLELARIEAAKDLDRSRIRAQAAVAIVVGVLALAIVVSSALLASRDRKAPEAFGGLLPLLGGGLTTMLGVTIGTSGGKK